MGNVVVLEYKWFSTAKGCIGCVFAFDKILNIYHGYIGIAKGYDEDTDANKIIDWGCRLTKDETYAMIGSEKARKLINSLEDEQWKY